MARWRAGNGTLDRLASAVVVGLGICGWWLAGATSASAQDGMSAGEESERARRTAKSAQSDFERRRLRYLPLGPPVGSTRCDGTVGRFCWWAEDGEWFPVPEDPRIVQMRADLLTSLDSLQRIAPDDDWILGQRVWYRAKSEDWEDAADEARACPTEEVWWCAALEGYALHHGGAYLRSAHAFERALAVMDPELRERWTIPRWTLDAGARDAIEGLEGDPGSLNRYLATVWAFADPLYLEPGNDRRTAHFARWVATELRRDARNPFQLRWGEDLTQLTVRNGWEVGWERARARDLTRPDEAIGRKQPESRDYMPPGSALRWAVEEPDPDVLIADRTAPRSLYAPAYAPVLLPMVGQVAAFPRGPTTIFVATQRLPPDTTFHARHDHPLPWMEPGDAAGRPPRHGLFAWPLEALGGSSELAVIERDEPYRTTVSGSSDGALLLEVPTGRYLVSSESAHPAERRAGRLRTVVRERRAVDDIATLSDIILLESDVSPLPATLEAAVPSLRPERTADVGRSIVVAWEVAGLGFRPEPLRFELSLRRADRGLVSRVGDFLGLSRPPTPVEVGWEEPGPAEPGPHFAALRLDPAEVEPGRYRLTVRLHTEGRTPVERWMEVTFVPATGS